MEDQIRNLIKQGRTKEALEMLVNINSEANVLLTKFLDADKKYRLGILNYDAYSQKLSEVTYGAMEYLQAPAAPAMASTDSSPKAASVTPITMLVAEGKIREALEILIPTHPEATGLATRFNSAFSAFTSGRIDFKEFDQVQSQVAAAIMNLIR